MNKENQRAIKTLKLKYAGDSDALEEIERATKSIEYYEQKDMPEAATVHLNNLEAFLNDWH